MLNIGGLKDGIVLDHIKAGRSMSIYHDLGLHKLEDCCVAIIKNARSGKMGRKDIIKIEGVIDLDLDVLGYIDHDITINIIRDGRIVEKRNITLPKRVTNVIKCKNPRCITSIEQELDHVFELSEEEGEIYRCIYCGEESHYKFRK